MKKDSPEKEKIKVEKKEIKTDHIETNNVIMEILNIKINRFTEKISGIKLYENDNLLVIIHNPGDYVLDGISFINKKYINRIEKNIEDNLKTIILKHKASFLKRNNHYRNFNTIKDIIKYFSLQKTKLIQINLESPTYTLIGNLSRLNEKSFILNMLSVKGKFLQEEKLEYSKIRILSVDNDYLNSLQYFLDQKGQE